MNTEEEFPSTQLKLTDIDGINILNEIIAVIDPRYLQSATIEEKHLKSRNDQYNIMVKLKPSLYHDNTSSAILCKVYATHIGFKNTKEKKDAWSKGEKINFQDIKNSKQLLDKEITKLFSFETLGCCSRYVECSDAKTCLHPDFLYASGACMYKKNLDAGRIFYGKNRIKDN